MQLFKRQGAFPAGVAWRLGVDGRFPQRKRPLTSPLEYATGKAPWILRNAARLQSVHQLLQVAWVPLHPAHWDHLSQADTNLRYQPHGVFRVDEPPEAGLPWPFHSSPAGKLVGDSGVGKSAHKGRGSGMHLYGKTLREGRNGSAEFHPAGYPGAGRGALRSGRIQGVVRPI